MTLKVVLFGLERVTASDSAGTLLLNPGNDHVITCEHKGFLICRSEAEARRYRTMSICNIDIGNITVNLVPVFNFNDFEKCTTTL